MSIAIFRKKLRNLLYKKIDDDSFMKAFNDLIYLSPEIKSAREEHQKILETKWFEWYGKIYPNKV